MELVKTDNIIHILYILILLNVFALFRHIFNSRAIDIRYKLLQEVQISVG